MKKLWLIFIAIFVFSFAVLGWVGTEIFRQAPPIPREVVTTDGQVLIPAEEISNGQNVWQAMGGMESGSIWGHGSYVAPDWSADYLHREALFILNEWSHQDFVNYYDNLPSEQKAIRGHAHLAHTARNFLDCNCVAMLEQLELGLKPRITYEVDTVFFDSFI